MAYSVSGALVARRVSDGKERRETEGREGSEGGIEERERETCGKLTG